MAEYGKLNNTTVSPTSEELTGTGPARASQIRSKYELINKEIEAEIEARNRGREQAGLSGPLSPAEEEAVAQQVLERNRTRLSGLAGPPAPEFNRPTTGTPIRPAGVSKSEPSKATPLETIIKEAAYRRPSPNAAEVGPPAESRGTLFDTIKEAARVVKQPEGTGQTPKSEMPAQVPVGGEGTKPSETKPTEGLSASQGKLKAAIDKVASGKSKTVPEDKLETLTKSLDDVEKSVPANSPARSDLLQLRAEAYKLYKEKADRNEWMDVAERALNAIGQLASARAATGQQVGGLPLSRTDYGARTEQAFREYQAELGLAGEKVRAEEREAERLQAAREKEIARRRGTIEERIKTERQARAEAGDTERARIAAAAREDVARMRGAQPKIPTQEIKGIDSEIRTTMDAIKAANRFAAAADDKAAKATLGGFLTATGLTPEEVDAEVKSRSAGIFTGPSKKEARQQFAAERVQELRDKLEELRGQRDTLAGGQQPIAQTPTVTTAATPAGQAAPERGIVIREVGGKRYKFDAKTKQNLGEVR